MSGKRPLTYTPRRAALEALLEAATLAGVLQGIVVAEDMTDEAVSERCAPLVGRAGSLFELVRVAARGGSESRPWETREDRVE